MGNPGFSLTSSPFVVALLSSKEMFNRPLANTSLSGFVSGRSQKENPAALPSAPVAVHYHYPGGEGADHCCVPGLSLPGGQHLLATVVCI